jgi:excisionase family DNA binding protein
MQTTEERLVYTPAEAKQLLGLSRGTMYKLLKSNSLPGILRLGKRILLSKKAIDGMLASGINPRESSAEGGNGKDV